MINNVLIAEWANLEIVKPGDHGLKGLIVEDGKLFYGKGGLRYAIPSGGCKPWSPDTDITLWHGPDGLLKTIEECGLMFDFIDVFTDESDPPLTTVGLHLWGGLTATPAQLTAALVKMIEEAPDVPEE